MQEKYELRLFAQYRDLLGDLTPQDPLPPRSIVVVLRGTVGDTLYRRVGELQQQLHDAGLGGVFASWNITRIYTRKEIESAQLFYLRMPYTHLAGEEYATKYREAKDCVQQAWDLELSDDSGRSPRVIPRTVPCGICSEEASILRVPFRRLSKNRDIVQLWGGELVFSQRLANLIREGGLTGADFYPVQDLRAEPTKPLDFAACPAGRDLVSVAAAQGEDPTRFEFWRWLYSNAPKRLLKDVLAQQKLSESDPSKRNLVQVMANSRPLDVTPNTRFGGDPFDTKANGKFRCQSGEIPGLNLISSLSILGSSWDGSDLCRTRVFVGGRQGLFRPRQLLVVSKRLWLAMKSKGMKGYTHEIVEIV